MRAIDPRNLAVPQFPMRFVVALMLVILAVCSGVARAGDFEDANQLYDQGKFPEAKERYEKLIETGGGSANVYYDLGNTDFRLGSAGRAILDYERSLVLNPRHPEARANLKLLREKSTARLLPLSWNEQIANNLSPDMWVIFAALAAWVVLFALVLIFTSRGRDNSVRWASAFFASIICAMAGVSLWSIARDQDRAVITAQQTEARLAPAESAGVAEALTAGSQVRVLSERGAWVYCELPGGGRGWVPDGAVERVRPGRS
jgi:tetratricopeptide (TPR) repeat protein